MGMIEKVKLPTSSQGKFFVMKGVHEGQRYSDVTPLIVGYSMATNIEHPTNLGETIQITLTLTIWKESTFKKTTYIQFRENTNKF